MAQPLMPTTVLSSDDPQATFEDVMTFIDGFDATSNLPPNATTTATDDSSDLLFSGFSSDTSDEDLLFAHSEELLGLLEATIPTEETTTTTTTTILTPVNPGTSQADLTCAANVSLFTTNTNPKEATRKRNVYREKMKRELQYLRLRAVEMEEQLTALRQGTVTALSPEDKQLIDSSWKRIARHQLEARVESEAENARLKSALLGHVEMARAVEQSLGKRFVLDEEVIAAKPKTKRGRVARTPWEDESFTKLAGDLDAAFDRLNQVMNDSGLDKAAVNSSRDFQMKTSVFASGVETPYIELTDTAVTPFPPRLTAKAVWRSLLHQYFHQNREDHDVEKIWQTGNTFAANCRSKPTLKTQGDQEVYLNYKIVLRKYIDEENRMVLVWRALNEGEGEHAGVYADETGWSVVQPLSGYCGLSADGSIIRSCIHVVHRHCETSEVQDPTVGVLAELVVASNEEELTRLTRSVENLLLDEVKSGAQGADSVVKKCG